MRKQALYRIEWDYVPGAGQLTLPATLFTNQLGPWGHQGNADLLYEGPLGRTTVTVEYREPDPTEKP